VEIQLRALAPEHLPRAQALLAASCEYDHAAEVAEEKLLGPAPDDGTPAPIGAFHGSDLVGLTATSQRWIRLLAVHPVARGRGVGGALLTAAERRISRAAGLARTLDQPGNYLAPGIDARNRTAVEWLERRGYRRLAENTSLLIDVTSNPRVSRARAEELAAQSASAGYTVRRASPADRAALSAPIALAFSRAWAFEIERALEHQPSAVHVALAQGGELAAFAAHDGNNRGLGWFGPAGTFKPHRQRGLGEALLLACLVDVAEAGLPRCTVAWIGPRGFYERAAGVADERQFVVLGKDLVREEAAA
jgi:GNAT superfamily N-acetyltransferase